MGDRFRKFAFHVAEKMGHPGAFVVAFLVIVLWAVTGPIFFLIQASQNRDSRAIQLKLDELIRAVKLARNELADLEEADEEELKAFAEEFRNLRQGGTAAQIKLGGHQSSGSPERRLV